MPPKPATPAPHPPPPPRLGPLPIHESPGPWFRAHRLAHDALHFGKKATYRFDSPARAYGVLYAGEDEHCALIETAFSVTGRYRLLSRKWLSGRSISRISSARKLRLVDITGKGLISMGADARLFSGDHATARAWSQAFHDHTEQPDGIRFRSRLDPSRFNVAIFERVRSMLSEAPAVRLDGPAGLAIVAKILKTYGAGLAP